MEKIKTISSTIPTQFDEKVNEFVANADVVITKHQIDTVSEGKRVKHVAYFHYLTTEEYKRYLEIKKQQDELKNKEKNTSKPKTTKKKRTVAKPVGNEVK